jgi:hypothetical protein
MVSWTATRSCGGAAKSAARLATDAAGPCGRGAPPWRRGRTARPVRGGAVLGRMPLNSSGRQSHPRPLRCSLERGREAGERGRRRGCSARRPRAVRHEVGPARPGPAAYSARSAAGRHEAAARRRACRPADSDARASTAVFEPLPLPRAAAKPVLLERLRSPSCSSGCEARPARAAAKPVLLELLRSPCCPGPSSPPTRAPASRAPRAAPRSPLRIAREATSWALAAERALAEEAVLHGGLTRSTRSIPSSVRRRACSSIHFSTTRSLRS